MWWKFLVLLYCLLVLITSTFDFITRRENTRIVRSRMQEAARDKLRDAIRHIEEHSCMN